MTRRLVTAEQDGSAVQPAALEERLTPLEAFETLGHYREVPTDKSVPVLINYDNPGDGGGLGFMYNGSPDDFAHGGVWVSSSDEVGTLNIAALDDDDGTSLNARIGKTYAAFAGLVAVQRVIPAVSVLSGGGTVTPPAPGIYFVTLGGATTINPPAGSQGGGESITFYLAQDATGGRVVTFSSEFKKSATLGTVASTINVITFRYLNGHWYQESVSLAVPV